MVVEKGKKEYVRSFMDAARKTWGSDIEEVKIYLEETAEAVWYVDGVKIDAETEPATKLRMRRYTEELV
ncbi:MAG: hypothetical protein ACLFVP_01845 [Candidatus Bathyarchaeia archaeon]